jgi:hypothetical protein
VLLKPYINFKEFYVLLLPNFQRSFGFFATQFFDWGCKGMSLYDLTKFILKKVKVNW